MGQSRASLLTTYQNIEKLLALFSKENDMSCIRMQLSFYSGVNRRASCMLSPYLTKTVYLLVNTFNLHELFSAESHNTNTIVNVVRAVQSMGRSRFSDERFCERLFKLTRQQSRKSSFHFFFGGFNNKYGKLLRKIVT